MSLSACTLILATGALGEEDLEALRQASSCFQAHQVWSLQLLEPGFSAEGDEAAELLRAQGLLVERVEADLPEVLVLTALGLGSLPELAPPPTSAAEAGPAPPQPAPALPSGSLWLATSLVQVDGRAHLGGLLAIWGPPRQRGRASLAAGLLFETLGSSNPYAFTAALSAPVLLQQRVGVACRLDLGPLDLVALPSLGLTEPVWGAVAGAELGIELHLGPRQAAWVLAGPSFHAFVQGSPRLEGSLAFGVSTSW